MLGVQAQLAQALLRALLRQLALRDALRMRHAAPRLSQTRSISFPESATGLGHWLHGQKTKRGALQHAVHHSRITPDA